MGLSITRKPEKSIIACSDDPVYGLNFDGLNPDYVSSSGFTGFSTNDAMVYEFEINGSEAVFDARGTVDQRGFFCQVTGNITFQR